MESSWAQQDNTSSVADSQRVPGSLLSLLFNISLFQFPIHEHFLILPGAL